MRPSGVTFVDNDPQFGYTATLLGTPAAGAAGNHPWIITFVGKGVHPHRQARPDGATGSPAITLFNEINVVVGGKVAFTVTTTGSPKLSPATYPNLPTWLMFNQYGDGMATTRAQLRWVIEGYHLLGGHRPRGIAGPDATQRIVNVLAITSVATTTFTVGQPGSSPSTNDEALGTFTESKAVRSGRHLRGQRPQLVDGHPVGNPGSRWGLAPIPSPSPGCSTG